MLRVCRLTAEKVAMFLSELNDIAPCAVFFMAVDGAIQKSEAMTKQQLATAECKYRFGKRFVSVSLWKDGKTFTCCLKRSKNRAVAGVFRLPTGAIPPPINTLNLRRDGSGNGYTEGKGCLKGQTGETSCDRLHLI
jgi:hypothetical protein